MTKISSLGIPVQKGSCKIIIMTRRQKDTLVNKRVMVSIFIASLKTKN